MSTQSTSLLSVVDGTDDLRHRVREALGRSRDYLLSIQNDDGHWCGELEGDTILESEYILTMHYLGRLDEPKVRKAANYIRDKQLPDGGWAIFPDGPPDVSASVKAYFVLKLLGDSPDSPNMFEARRVIRELGGLEACNSFTKIYLSIFGQYDFSGNSHLWGNFAEDRFLSSYSLNANIGSAWETGVSYARTDYSKSNYETQDTINLAVNYKF